LRIFHLQTIVTNQKEILPGYFRLNFFAPKIAKTAQPGQFVHIYCGRDTYLRRPFSIAGVKKNQVEIIYKVVGKGTELLSQKKKGETLDLLGPLGNGFSYSPVTSHHSPVLIAGGTGVVSLLFLAERLSTYKLINLPAHRSVSGGGSTVVLIGAKTKNDLLCVSDFKQLALNRKTGSGIGCQVKFATEDGSLGFKGLVTDLFRDFLSAYQPRREPKALLRGQPINLSTIYACGPYQMLKEIAKICERKQIKCQVSLENIMACGIGACRGCVIKTRMTTDKRQARIAADKFVYKTVCRDGPIFEANQIIWE